MVKAVATARTCSETGAFSAAPVAAAAGAGVGGFPSFAKVAGAVAQVGGPKLEPPGAGTLAQALDSAPLPVQRALWAQVVLGGLKL
ncbi:MAG TPA: hypothetical protein VFH51_16995, partial [Myxococcota bacterium]|nr:hypothetical protein [Myxococcota bacterium]